MLNIKFLILLILCISYLVEIHLLSVEIKFVLFMAKREKRSRSKGSAGNNRKSGEDFLLQNSKKEGVYETESGLQVLVISP